MYKVEISNGMVESVTKLHDIVCDADTGEILPGQPSERLSQYVLARAIELGGTWMLAEKWQYRLVRTVRIVTYEQTIGALVRIVCELAAEADERSEMRRYERAVKRDAERNLEHARAEIAEFHDGHRRGWSAAELAEAHRLERNLNAALTAAGESDAT